MEPVVSIDPGRLDLDLIHDFLSQSYWARGIPRKLFGFEPLAAPGRFMELHAPDVYATPGARIRENGGFGPDGKGKA